MNNQGNPNFPILAFDFFLTHGQDWWGNLGNYFIRWSEPDAAFSFQVPYFLGVSSTQADRINYCYTLRDGTPLAARGATIYRLRLTAERVDTLPWHHLQYLRLRTITCIFQDHQGRIYLGDESGRLVVLEQKNQQLHKLTDFTDIGRVNGIGEDSQRELVWIATTKGLTALQIADLTLRRTATDPTGESYAGVLLDKTGNLWLPGSKGLSRYHPDSGYFHRFGTADGLLSESFGANTFMISSRTGEIWLGGNNGLNVFRRPARRIGRGWSGRYGGWRRPLLVEVRFSPPAPPSECCDRLPRYSY